MLSQLKLSFIGLKISHFHPLEIEVERVSGKEPFTSGVPVVESDEIAFVDLVTHQLVLESGLGLFGCIEGEFVAVVVDL